MIMLKNTTSQNMEMVELGELLSIQSRNSKNAYKEPLTDYKGAR